MHARFVTRARSTARAGVSGRADRWRCGREAGLHAYALRARGPPRSSYYNHTLLHRLSIRPPPWGRPDAGHARVASRSRKRLYPPGLFRSAGKYQKRYRLEMPRAPRAGSPAGSGSARVSTGQRRGQRGQHGSARVSPGGSRRPAARSQGAEGAGNHTRCRRGSRRDGAPGMERRSCAHLLAISARRQDEVRAAARSWLVPGCGADFVTGWMFALDFVIGRRQPGRPVRRRWRGASGAGARPPALPRSGRPIRRTSRGGTARN